MAQKHFAFLTNTTHFRSADQIKQAFEAARVEDERNFKLKIEMCQQEKMHAHKKCQRTEHNESTKCQHETNERGRSSRRRNRRRGRQKATRRETNYNVEQQ